MSLVDFLDSMEEQEEEMMKVAAEEDAAGRIMARGFMDELNKLAATQTAPEQTPKSDLPGGPLMSHAKKRVPPPTYRETGPYGLRSGGKQPKVKGLQAFEGKSKLPPRDRFPERMRQMARIKKTYRPEGVAGLAAKASRAGRAVSDTVKSYGRTFSRFGKGIASNVRGEEGK